MLDRPRRSRERCRFGGFRQECTTGEVVSGRLSVAVVSGHWAAGYRYGHSSVLSGHSISPCSVVRRQCSVVRRE